MKENKNIGFSIWILALIGGTVFFYFLYRLTMSNRDSGAEKFDQRSQDQKDSIWSKMGGFFTMISALAAAFSVYQTKTSLDWQYKKDRPYFTIQAPEIVKIDTTKRYLTKFAYKNIGVRPALKFHGSVVIVEADFIAPYPKMEISSSNDIPSAQPISWYMNDKETSPLMPKHFMIITFEYSDINLKYEYKQIFYMKWKGAQEGLVMAQYNEAFLGEKDKLEQILKSNPQFYKRENL